MDVTIRDNADLTESAVVALYRSCNWSAAEKPKELMKALANSDAVITAWQNERLVGLVNAISDGALVVYYPHLLVAPDAQHHGIGSTLLARIQERYHGFHQQVLLAYSHAVGFYQRSGFVVAQGMVPFWIYPSAQSEQAG